ncbi:SRPBCC domain-containing protein [Streptomyces sp. NPDC089799]|uniref:SRPBCC domain-containing protein n=1 Tax=Streptomyces sp. NPDC089799 TaxID=3155066 RepID=UPI003419299D
MSPVSHGTSERRDGDHWLLHIAPHVAHAYETVWQALTTPEGLHGWLAEAETLERHLGGAVTLHWPDPDTRASGQVTAWDVERVAEYTFPVHGRMRFHLEPLGTDSTLIRFTAELHGDGSYALDRLAGWHDHFLLLEDYLEGHPVYWPTWTPSRRTALRTEYAAQLQPH